MVLFTLLGAMSAVLEILLVPFYVGGVIFPITLVLAIAGNVFLARGLRSLVGSMGLAALPLLAWVLVVLVMGFFADSKGDVFLPGYGQGQYVSLGAAARRHRRRGDGDLRRRQAARMVDYESVNLARLASFSASWTALSAAGGRSDSTSWAPGNRASSSCRSAIET